MTAIQHQLQRFDLYEEFMGNNIRRIMMVATTMRMNISKCRQDSVLSWKEKADGILNRRLNGKKVINAQ
jgi:hypothetical protein